MKDLVLTGVTDDLDQPMMIHVFQHELSRVLDKHAPIVIRKLSIRQPKPWFNEDIKKTESTKKREDMEKVHKESPVVGL